MNFEGRAASEKCDALSHETAPGAQNNKIIPKIGPRHFWQPLLLFLLLFHVHLDVILMQELFLNNTTGLLATPKSNKIIPKKSGPRHFWQPLLLFLHFFHVHLHVMLMQELVLNNAMACFATPTGSGPLIVGGSEFPRKNLSPEK